MQAVGVDYKSYSQSHCAQYIAAGGHCMYVSRWMYTGLHILSFPVPCRAMPHFTSTPYTVTVSEATPVGTILINVTAIPGTPGNTLSYIIFNHPPIFQIDNITGSIYLVGPLDYEQATSHVFNTEVKEQSDVVMTQVTVRVTNENDNPLTCDQTLVVVSIPEGPPSPSNISLSCVDRDEPSGSIDYQIVSGNDTGWFSIDIDGILHIIGDLDYERHKLHEVLVNASSGGTPSPDSTLLLTVLIVVEPRNEYSPMFENDDVMFTFNVSESATIGTTVGTIRATDADAGVDGDLIFSTVSPSTQGIISLQPSTGQLVLTQALDYEQATLYELTVTVSDSPPDTLERLSSTAVVIINIVDVNEYDPIFSQEFYVVMVSEDETVGSEIITVGCADNDSDSTVSYSIESGNDANNFSIDSTTGTVMLVSEVDYDPDSSLPYQLLIQCKDSGSPSRSAQSTLIISVEGHNRNLAPSLSVEDYTVSLSEDSSLGTTVVSLASVAADTNRGLAGPLQFSIDHNSNCPQSIFLITPNSGTVYLVGLVDHETSPWYVCDVSVSNRESTTSATLNVFISVTDVNDEVPLCLQTLYTLSIPEDSAVGSDLLTLSCSDADSDILEYSIIETSHTFQLTQSGVLSLLTQVDSDVLSTHNVHINVSDGLYAVQLSVFIYIEPSNEAVPTFNQTVYDCSLPEDTSIGSTICTVTATDIDSGPDGDISYSITSGNDDNIFAINSSSGEVILAGYIDYEVIQGYVILVCASDSADLPLSSSVQVRISVLDSNDNAPIISPLISVSIEENSAIGSAIIELECSDVDSGSNADVTLTINSLSSINVAGLETEETDVFLIDSLTNELVLDTIVDFESSILYKLTITCRDNGNLPLISSSTVLVSITPLNEFAPVLSQENYYVSVSESSDIGTSLLQITATDNDKGVDGDIEYSIESSEGGVNFLQISATSGNIFTQQLLNCDWGRTHDFTIIATDRGSPVLTSQSQLHITFENCQLGQLTPRKAIYFADVMENSPTNTEVITVGCDTERVWEEDSAPEYGILSPVESPFQIDPLVGQISISTPPDYEQATSYMLQLNCTDPSSPQSYAYFSVYITILPENEHLPEFIHSIYEGEIAEDVPPGTSVLQVQANDDDSDMDGRLFFSIHESVQSFTVDSMTGVIYTLASLNREDESFYSFHVVAVDQLGQGDNMHYSMTEVQVSVRDTNDNAPLCDRVVYHVTISPLVHVGYRVLSLECTDADTDLNSELHYSLHSESPNSLELFSLNENTGDLMLAREFDASSALIHQMIITVEDNGVPSLSTVTLVVVEVQSSVVMKDEADGESLVEVEGARNALELTLKDISIELVSYMILQVGKSLSNH